MIQKLVSAALRMPFIVFISVAAVIAAGLYCYRALDIEAYPNPVPPLVELITQPEGWSPEEVERQVTRFRWRSGWPECPVSITSVRSRWFPGSPT